MIYLFIYLQLFGLGQFERCLNIQLQFCFRQKIAAHCYYKKKRVFRRTDSVRYFLLE